MAEVSRWINVLNTSEFFNNTCYIQQIYNNFLGMGDQIKRYCEKLEPEDYEELLDNEVDKNKTPSWTDR